LEIFVRRTKSKRPRTIGRSILEGMTREVFYSVMNNGMIEFIVGDLRQPRRLYYR